MSLATPSPAVALAPTSPPALTPFPFRTLPSEVRNVIYTLLFDKNAHPDGGDCAASPQILSTCHQVNHEATRLLYTASMAQVVVRKDGVEVGDGLERQMDGGEWGRVEEKRGRGGDRDVVGVGEDAERARMEEGERTREEEKGSESGGGRAKGRGRGDSKHLRRFEVFAVEIIDDTTTREERTQLVHAVAELCAALAENCYLRSLAVDMQMVHPEQGARKQEEEEEKRLLEPFRTLKGVRDVQFTGAIGNWSFVAGLREEMMRGDGGEEGEEEMDLAAWEDVEGSAM